MILFAPIFRLAAAALGWACLPLPMNAESVHAGAEKVLFDFQAAPPPPAWEIVNDDVMGGVSTSRFQVFNTGGAVFSGVISLENNGGFASVRSSLVRGSLGGTDAILVRVRGDGRRYKFTVRTGADFNAPHYQLSFNTKRGEWAEHRLAFKDFVPTFRGRILPDAPLLEPVKATSVGLLISDQQEGPFKLELAWIKASAPAGK